MKVRLCLAEDRDYCSGFSMYTELPDVPRYGDVLDVDMSPIKEAIIKAGRVEQYKKYVNYWSSAWYRNAEVRKMRPKPTVEEMADDLDFENLTVEVVQVVWDVYEDGAMATVFVDDYTELDRWIDD